MLITSRIRRVVLAALILAVFCASAAQHAPAQAVAVPGATGSTPATPSGPTLTEQLIGNAVSSPDSPQYKDVTEAITTFKNGDMARARALLTQAVKTDSKLPPVEVMMGRMLIASGYPGPGRNELESAVIATPDDPEAFLILANLAIADKRVTDAEALVLRAQPLITNFKGNAKRKRNFDIQLHSLLGIVAQARKQWDVAAEQIKAWIELDDKNAQAHFQMGRTLFQQGKPTEAYNEFEKAQQLEPKSINPYIALAQLYEQNKDHNNASKSIGYAIQKSPKDLNVHLQAAQWAVSTNQLNEAKTYSEKALTIDPKSLEAKIARGLVARLMRDMNTAEKYLNEAVSQQPANLEASNQLALVLIESDDKDKKDRALQFSKLNAAATDKGQNQFSPEIMATYAWVLYKTDNKQEAQQVLSRVLQLQQITPDTAFYFAKILQDAGNIDQAISVLETALKSTAPFGQREASGDLLAQLKKEKDAKDKEKDKDKSSKGSDSSSSSKKD